MRAYHSIANGLVVAASVCALISLSALLSTQHVLFDLLSHFRVQYIILLIPVFLLAIVRKKTTSVLIICFALAVHGYSVTMSLLPRSSLSSQSEYVELTVFTSNILLVNNRYQEMLELIQSVSPDIIAFQEYTYDWHSELSGSLNDYPYVSAHPAHGAFGVALYSKYPLSNERLQDTQHDAIKLAIADVVVEGKTIQISSVHPPPPVSQGMYEVRNSIMQSIGEQASATDIPVVVMGDFNATPWSGHYSTMMSAGKLHNARAGFGFHPTWPSHNVLLQIPIDHILVSNSIRSVDFGSQWLKGSDHRALWSTVRVY